MSFSRTYFAWGIAALFYCFQYVLRVLPANIEPELRSEFGLTAHEFGAVGSFTIYAYALMQIPVGILVDRLGLKKVLLSSVAICVLGAFAMAFATDLAGILASRVLIGIGSASAFMSALKIAADYLPLGRRGLLMGATLTLGVMGAILTGSYLVHLIALSGWRSLTMTLGFLGIALFVLTFIGVNLKSTNKTSAAFRWSDLVSILKNRPVMTYAILAIGVYTPLSVLADLWGPAFLMQKYELTQAEASFNTTLLFAGLGIGSLILPALCEKWNCLDFAIQFCSFAILILFGLLLFGPVMPQIILRTGLILIGICCGAEMMCFTGAVQFTTASNSGLTLGVVNTLNMLGGALLQHSIGYLLDWQWQGLVDPKGIRLYDTEQFVVALSLLLSVIALCCLLSLSLKRRVFNGR
ncbi:MAG: MFS transporter [Myxococcota bacterium]